MIFATHIPKSPLNSFVSHFTYYKDYTPHHRIDRFLPDGNIEIVIDLTSTSKYIYDNYTLQEKQACKKLWISGIRNKFITIPSGYDSEMFIINFKKGMVYPFIKMPLYEITDTVVDEQGVLSKDFLTLREQLLNCTDAPAMFLLVQQFLFTKYCSQLTINPFIDYATCKIVQAPQATTIASIAGKVGYSSKHLITLFKEQVGVTPKAFLRIIRFQKTIQEIERKKKINWAMLASECGYYDQSHFIADFKTFSGFTPAGYMQQKGDYLNYVPVG